MKERAWVEVNLDNISHNLSIVKKLTKSKICAVVKADAYGHGVLETAKTLLASGADYLAVACLDEAKQLRNMGVTSPLLILGHTTSLDEIAKYDLIQTVYNIETAKVLSFIGKKYGKKIKIHIKIDSGMNRLGFLWENLKLDDIIALKSMRGIEIEGIFSHFSTADEVNSDFTELQFERFINICDRLKENGLDIPVRHICNSAATYFHKDFHLEMVRCGLILYGLYPSLDMPDIGLLPAMSFKAIITNIKEVPKNSYISYGRHFKTKKRATRVATIPVGYADGYSRLLSSKAEMFVCNKPAKVIGNICMDQCMIDISEIDDARLGTEVELFGSSIRVDTIAKIMNTINYEVVCLVGKRIPRIYIQNGRIVDVLNYLD